MQAANVLRIDKLLDLTCEAVADLIKGKTPEEIRGRFNITDDYSEEEKEEYLNPSSTVMASTLPPPMITSRGFTCSPAPIRPDLGSSTALPLYLLPHDDVLSFVWPTSLH
ncbi:hypothetical protein PR202_ga01756 [Eleusine coracana subsp. coracana]|uniref:SKP1 component dimerisation domain-containing protein n=1 Tax=Eleusine coracana subsp. coracana TaxID=191504 RepID=A0AAV5BJR7_ELECO|nr:hypothetical protein PR202_ga01069 [Eleusine coracana subsp. coracana]GJM85945.1 hypothetical protein PR202_ga01756 [Eleusine coracana subsp. coracana]